MSLATRFDTTEKYTSDDASVRSRSSLTAVFDATSDPEDDFEDILDRIEPKVAPSETSTSWNDEVQSEIESLGLSLHDSLVMALRDEATRMDAVMTANHVNSLEDEVWRLSRELAERKKSVEELRSSLKEREERIGTLELERDLYKADTSKLTKDLHKCRQNLKAMEVASREATPRTRSTVTTSHGELDRPSLSMESWGSGNNSSITSTTLSRSEASGPSFPVVEKPKLVLRNRKNTRHQPTTRQRPRGFQFCRGFPSRRPPQKDEVELVEIENPDMVLQEQLQEMSKRMNAALEISDELRRRLAMVSRYYEGQLGKMEHEMVCQLSASEEEKQVIVDSLQSQLHEQELIITGLRNTAVRPFK